MRQSSSTTKPTKIPERYIKVNGIKMSRQEWKHYMDDCPHDKFSYPGAKLMDGSLMAICDRCKFMQHEPIAKIIEGKAAE